MINIPNELWSKYGEKRIEGRGGNGPQIIVPELKTHLEYIKELHQKDINTGYAGAFVDGLLEKKYKGCGKELVWQWFFSATISISPNLERKFSWMME